MHAQWRTRLHTRGPDGVALDDVMLSVGPVPMSRDVYPDPNRREWSDSIRAGLDSIHGRERDVDHKRQGVVNA